MHAYWGSMRFRARMFARAMRRVTRTPAAPSRQADQLMRFRPPLRLLGVGIEILQGLTAVGRSADLADIAANVVGIAVGLLIWGWGGLIRRSPHSKGEDKGVP